MKRMVSSATIGRGGHFDCFWSGQKSQKIGLAHVFFVFCRAAPRSARGRTKKKGMTKTELFEVETKSRLEDMQQYRWSKHVSLHIFLNFSSSKLSLSMSFNHQENMAFVAWRVKAVQHGRR